MKAIQVLGRFDRHELHGVKWLEHHFRVWLWDHGVAIRSKFSVTIRKPSQKPADIDIQKWHQDGCQGDKVRFWLVMWSDKLPTHYRLKRSKREVTVNPGDVVLVRNDLVEHRAPMDTMPGRWFIRVSDAGLLIPMDTHTLKREKIPSPR